MYCYFRRMRIGSINKVTRVRKAMAVAKTDTFIFHHFGCVSWIHPGRLGWNFPYEQHTTEFVPLLLTGSYEEGLQKTVTASGSGHTLSPFCGNPSSAKSYFDKPSAYGDVLVSVLISYFNDPRSNKFSKDAVFVRDKQKVITIHATQEYTYIIINVGLHTEKRG